MRTERELLDQQVTIPLSESMVAALEEAAQEQGIRSPRTYARSVLVRHLRELGLYPNNRQKKP